MKRILAAMCFVSLAGCAFTIPDFRSTPAVAPAPLPPVAAPQSAKDRFIATTAANVCSVTSANSAIIMQDAVLSREDLARIMTELRAEGRGVIGVDGTSFRLMTGACA